MEKAWHDENIPKTAGDVYKKYWEKLATMIYNNINIKINNSESSGGGKLLPINSFHQKLILITEFRIWEEILQNVEYN